MRFWLWLGLALGSVPAFSAGQVVDAKLTSTYLKENLLGVNPERAIKIYLPPGYETGTKAYPVIYYFHSIFWSSEQMFADGVVKALLDRAIGAGVIGDVILVAADFSTPQVGSFYGNAASSGRWLDMISGELVPFIDANFRTLANRQSRGLAGDFLGGYAALKLAMLQPDLFNAVYALHPVGTGTGLVPMSSRPDWRKMNQAQSWDDLAGDGFSTVFMAMAQAYLPNPQRPPFYADMMVELQGDRLVVNVEHSRLLQNRFLLDQMLPQYAENLRQLAGIKFDWGRYDPNQDHVYANQAFSRLLDEYGVEHYAEEYRGYTSEKNWIEHGRVYDDMLPFFKRFLVFKK